jgi:hypothetical protein
MTLVAGRLGDRPVRTLADLRAIYDARIHPLVHDRW